MWRPLWLLFIFLFVSLANAQPEVSANLARSAIASASENFGAEMSAEKAIDGKENTRWSGIPGHNSGVWFQLNWKQRVTIGQLVIKQYDRYSMEWDVQILSEDQQTWKTLRHDGKNGAKLPLVVVDDFPSVTTSALRISHITNGPSFNEVEVFERPNAYPPVISTASDLQGNFIGIVTDAFGSEGHPAVQVKFQGQNQEGPWQYATRTDENGLFKIPMVAHLQGNIDVRCSNGASTQLHATDFQYGVTPVSIDTPKTSLDGVWKFSLDPPAEFFQTNFDDTQWNKIAVPGHWEMQSFRSQSGVGGYRRWFNAPTGSGRVILRFDGVYSGAEVWINGKKVAYHEGGFTPFEADITDDLVSNQNLLAVRVTEHTLVSDKLDHMSLYADFPLSGITRKVYLFRIPDTHISRYESSSTVAKDGQTAQLSGQLFAQVSSPSHPETLHFKTTLQTLSGSVLAQTGSIPMANPVSGIGQSTGSFSLKIQNPKTWTAETPDRYVLKFELYSGKFLVQTLQQKIGIRQTTIEGSTLLVNQKPVKIRGTCHHDQDPLIGRAVNVERTKQDLEMIKDANLNAVRTSHYPPIPELLDLADEMGLYVEDEASFCWADASDDLRNAPRIIQLTAELVARDRNHPSVFMWSICNESHFGIDFERSHEWVKANDSSRPVAAATSAWLDIATLHNPISLGRIHDNEKLDKPLLFDESWCIYQGIFNDVAEMWVDPGMRDYYAEPLQQIYRAMMDSRVTQGSQIWAWSDDLFCVPGRGLEYGRGTTMSHFVEGQYAMPGRGIVGDAPWGVVDGWRREKPEFWITKKLHSPIKLSEKPINIPAPGSPIQIQVENQFDFLNLNQVVAKYQFGSDHGTVVLDVKPHQAGMLSIPTNGSVAGGLDLILNFSTPKNRLIDTYRIRVGTSPSIPKTTKVTKPLFIQETNVLAGEGVDVVGSDFDLLFDKSTGLLRRGVVHGNPTLLELPRLHILPTEDPTRPIPTIPTWNLKSMDWKRQGEEVVFSIKGNYPEFDGGYLVTLSPTGDLTVESEFTYFGKEMTAREIGLSWSVPKTMDLLDWNRNAEWNQYPNDHIGRPVGTAAAFDDEIQTVPPKNPWSRDNSPMGTNDFRSTKRRISSGAIRSRAGEEIDILSDGSQNLRAMVESDRISVHVNDWFGGTNVGWGEWITNYGRGKTIHKGDVLKSRVHLKLGFSQRQINHG